MRRFLMALPLTAAFMSVSSIALAQDDDRLDRMQQTIQELTLQLSDAIRENGDLRKELRAAREGNPSANCPPITPHAHAPSSVMPRDGSAPRPMMTAPADVKSVETPRAESAAVACDVDGIVNQVRSLPDATTREYYFNQWLADHAEKCSKSELGQLRQFGRSLSLSDDALSLIDYYMDQ